jgi:hypothetical protein
MIVGINANRANATTDIDANLLAKSADWKNINKFNRPRINKGRWIDCSPEVGFLTKGITIYPWLNDYMLFIFKSLSVFFSPGSPIILGVYYYLFFKYFSILIIKYVPAITYLLYYRH